jgi:2-polyprenyl-3-methyl-5-hydroxy-6-metoxy-1,4-benzoquinol methylase
MKKQLVTAGYVLDPITDVWSRSSYSGIAYSDGDEVEDRILRIINESQDVSVLSDELQNKITDWPSLYHLSRSRANLLRPFQRELNSGLNLLEIGAGCGAITRFLGESGANVLALEGSMRRASIARARTRDLRNVHVLAEQFDQFACRDKFDVVTLIGVLEYANRFTQGPNAALRMLERAKSLLKPDGSLILAIENQLGLKYLSGAPEDHLGIRMYGIEGRYGPQEPKTFGRRELLDLLSEAGFKEASCLAPFPDYKLPKSILTERALNDETFDSAALVSSALLCDPQLPRPVAFAPELVAPVVIRNRLMLDLANSFLVTTGSLSKGILDRDDIAWHYSTTRRSRFCKETVFARSRDGVLGVRARSIAPVHDEKDAPESPLWFAVPASCEYFPGHLLAREFSSLLSRDGWTLKELRTLLMRYLSIVQIAARERGCEIDIDTIDGTAPGWLIDAIPLNILIKKDGVAFLFDQEWQWKQDISVGFLVFRAIYASLHSLTHFGESADSSIKTVDDILQQSARCLGWQISNVQIITFIKLEDTFQYIVSSSKPRDSEEIELSLKRRFALPRSVWEQPQAGSHVCDKLGNLFLKITQLRRYIQTFLKYQ